MPWTPLDSTMIAAYDYDRELRMLHLRLLRGETYSYRDVPAEIAAGLQDTDSPGAYWHRNIKGKYGVI